MLKGFVPAAPNKKGNSIISSEVVQFEQGFKKAKKISLKYVIQGFENYEVNRQFYKVNEGSFLIINEGSDYVIPPTPKQLKEGLCVYFDSEFLRQGLHSIRNEESKLLENPYDYRDVDIEIFEGLYNDPSLGLNKVLTRLSGRISEDGIIEGFSEEDYMEMAEAFVICQQDITDVTLRIKAKKPSVQKELYKRVHMARVFMDENLFNPITIDTIAQVVQMSPFHFQRKFREIQQITPYQYLINERLKKAHQLLEKGHYKATEVALMLAFSDIYSFSKAFKQRFSYSPRQVLSGGGSAAKSS